MKKIRARASKPQAALVNSAAPFPAFVGGFGSGKTQALIMRALRLKLAYPGQNIGYYLPTYDLVKMIGYPRFEDVLERMRLKYRLNKSEHVIYIRGKGNIIFRTLDNPDRIVGYEVADSLVDELDTLKTDAAKRCWEQIIARNRQKKPDGSQNTAAVGTTPEGFRFVYEKWKKAPTESYQLIQAPTYSNLRNLPADYIDRLKETYPENRLSAYINGEFVNLTSGTVYAEFDRLLNATTETHKAGEPLHLGMDFNVYNMSAVVHVIRGDQPLAVDELTGIKDTPAMIAAVKERYPGHSIFVYPDASGKAAKSVNASISDISLLKQAGFKVIYGAVNPPVRDRVLSVCSMLCNALGHRRYLINIDRCPELAMALEQQVYDKNGAPDKTAGHDHLPDAAGYFIYRKFPLKGKPQIKVS